MRPSKALHPKKRIKTLHDLELEKTRLQYEILKVEDRIKYDFRGITDFISLKSALRIVTNNLSLTGKVITKGFSIVKGFFSKKKNNGVKNNHIRR